MNKTYSHDPEGGFLWSWDGDFHFEGTHGPLEGMLSFFDENREYYEATGALFLSGLCRHTVIVRCEDGHASVSFGKYNKGIELVETGIEQSTDDLGKIISLISKIKTYLPIVLCGKSVKDPSVVSRFCELLPCRPVYACPVVDELASFGRLVMETNENPRRVVMWHPNVEQLEYPNRVFDPKLDGDGLGRMAHLVNRGVPVYNDMYSGVGIPTFYKQLIHNRTDRGTIYIVRGDAKKELFPSTPVSAWYYAATQVPVCMNTSNVFRERTGNTNEKVDVIVATDRIPELTVFMNFYKAFSGKDFVCMSRDKMNIGKRIPLFRHDKGYVLTKEEFDAVGLI